MKLCNRTGARGEMLRKYDFWLKDARTFTDENGLGGTWWRGACLILGGLVWGAGDPLYDPPLHLLGVCLSSGEGSWVWKDTCPVPRSGGRVGISIRGEARSFVLEK